MTALAAPPQRLRVADQREEGVAVAHFRLMVIMLMFIGVTLAIAAKLMWMAASAGPSDTGAGRDALVPPRADIVDRNGVPLARTFDAWSIAVHPNRLTNDPRFVARKLAELLPERTEAQYLAILKSGKPFVYLRRRALPELVKAVNAIGEPGIALGREPERIYPQGSLASHALGWLDLDGRPAAGMERVLDQRLNDAQARAAPVSLSIDTRVQAALESELGAAMAKHGAIGATGLVLDVQTGELLAMVSMPVFNPNQVGAFSPDARRNNVTQSVYELGSTFKPLTVANAIESGVVTSMSKRWDATAPLQVGRFRITDFKGQNRYLNVPEALVHSSNIVTARIADELGQARTSAFFHKLGFDAPPDIELIEKGRPIWPGFWARTTVMTVAYGHGIAVTPLHLANAYAAMVNGGVWRPATLIKREPGKAPAGRRVMSEATSARMRQLLRMVVLEGSGKKANVPGMRIGGKTGTADKPNATGGYSGNARVSTFASAFPMDAPRYVVIGMLDDPKATADTYGYATAGWTVAPAIGRAIARIGPILGVVPDETRDVDVSQLMPLIWKPKAER